MSRSARADLRLDLAREELRWRRDARYRANIAFAITQLRTIALLVILIGSLIFGWPIPHTTLTHIASLHVGRPSF